MQFFTETMKFKLNAKLVTQLENLLKKYRENNPKLPAPLLLLRKLCPQGKVLRPPM